jgi:hypothetical protein
MVTIDEAVIRKSSWKNECIKNYCIALVRAGMERAFSACPYFNNDEVPEPQQPNDKTTVGAAFRMLMTAGVILPFRGTIESKEIFGGMRASTRAGNNRHRNQLYVLTSAPVAAEWLLRQGAIPPPTPVQNQMNLFN